MILQEQNREQVKMFTSLEDLVSKDNPVSMFSFDELKRMIASVLGINCSKLPYNVFNIDFIGCLALIFTVKPIA